MGLMVYIDGTVVLALEKIREAFFPVPRVGEFVQLNGLTAKVRTVQHNYNESNMCVHVFAYTNK